MISQQVQVNLGDRRPVPDLEFIAKHFQQRQVRAFASSLNLTPPTPSDLPRLLTMTKLEYRST